MLLGVLAGIIVGILPGMGGIVAVAILLPFVTQLDAVGALALLTGALAVVHTSDTVTSVLIGAPGSSASVTSVIEGHALAKQGQAARALSAAYLSSLIGGLIGALGLTLSIPIARPLVLSFGSPELFMLTALGVSFAGSLLGKEPRRGIIAGLLGLLLGSIGSAPAAAQVRFAFERLYLMDGLDLAIVALGIFGLAEVVSLLAKGGAIARRVDLGSGWMQGLRDVVEHRWLLLRGSLIGIWAGVLPAIGATAGTWMAYGHAAAVSRRHNSRFGKGDIRGIIAPEAANNAVEAGDLVPTLLFSVPGSAPAAMIMGALLAYGVVPGPRVVTEHLDLIYAIIWTFALANIIGAAIMFLASPVLARLTHIPFSLVAPPVILMMILAAFQEAQQFGDLLALIVLGVVGYAMKVTGWPRAPLLIGFVLSGPLERYFHLTISLYPNLTWLNRPAVIVIGILLISPFIWGAWRALRTREKEERATPVRWAPGMATVVSVGLFALFAYAAVEARGFLPAAGRMPLFVAIPGAVLCVVQLVQEIRGRSVPVGDEDEVEEEPDRSGPPSGVAPQIRRAFVHLAAIAACMMLIWVVGFRVAAALWVLGFSVGVAQMPWPRAVLYTASTVFALELLARVLSVRLPVGLIRLF
ncbi:MAG: tripartite tricarboxylate transporter permease [bacterium]